jgi:uncharacterized Zn-binding protein involved in type VI secretion
MGAPAAVMGDQITGICPAHLLIGPLGVPVPAPPLPFAAPLTTGVIATVLICGKPAAVVGSGGINMPPHVGLHPSDPFLAPPLQMGSVVAGSATVLIGGSPAATAASSCTLCAGPGMTVAASAATVLIG